MVNPAPLWWLYACTHVCTPASDISGRAHLRSAERREMLVPRTRTELGRRSFPVAAPTVWNSLPAHLRSTMISRRQFRDGLNLLTYLLTPIAVKARECARDLRSSARLSWTSAPSARTSGYCSRNRVPHSGYRTRWSRSSQNAASWKTDFETSLKSF